MTWHCRHCGTVQPIIHQPISASGSLFYQCRNCGKVAEVRKNASFLKKLSGYALYGLIGLALLSVIGTGALLYLESDTLLMEPRTQVQAKAKKPGRKQGAGTAILKADLKPIPRYRHDLDTEDLSQDEIIQAKMAPSHDSDSELLTESQETQSRQKKSDVAVASIGPLRVRAVVDNADLHSGPGVEFPLLGIANNDTVFIVRGWKGDWFLLSPANQSQQLVWVRNDLIEPADAKD